MPTVNQQRAQPQGQNVYRNILIVLAPFLAVTGASVLLAQDQHAVGEWNFDSDLVDRSGRGNNAFAAAPAFAPGHSGQGLRCGQAAAVV